MKLSAGKIDAFLRSPDKNIRAILLYGPDAGLVRERGKALVDLFADKDDPFSVQEFTGDALRKDATLLADGARALSLMGGAPVLRIRDVTDVATETIDAWLADGGGVHPVIFEAGDLTPRSKLRTLFEKHADAAAAACYVDEGGDLRGLVSAHFAAAKVRIDNDAMAMLLGRLGNDRLAVRQELDKLILYAGGPGTGAAITLADVEAAVGDARVSSLDDVVFAVGGGDLGSLQTALARAQLEGLDVTSLLRGVQRHFDRLHEVNAEAAAGGGIEPAMKKLRPPVFFKYTSAFAAQARRWTTGDLARGLQRLLETERQCKSGLGAEWALCERCLMQLAQAARRGAR